VTGASDGIGKEFAFQLAKSGFNVFLVARNKQLLDSTAKEIGVFADYVMQMILMLIIETKYSGVSTRTYSIDFAKGDEKAYAGLSTAFEGLDVGVLGALPDVNQVF